MLLGIGLRNQTKRVQAARELDAQEQAQGVRSHSTFADTRDIVKLINDGAQDETPGEGTLHMHGAVHFEGAAVIGGPVSFTSGTISNASRIDTSEQGSLLTNIPSDKIELYQSRAERRKQGERGSLQLKATLSKKASECR